MIPINIKSLTSAPAGATKLHSAAQQQPHMGPALLVMARCLDGSAAPPTRRAFPLMRIMHLQRSRKPIPGMAAFLMASALIADSNSVLQEAGESRSVFHLVKDWECCVLPLLMQA